MRARNIPRVVLFLIFLFCTTGATADAGIEPAAGGSLLISKAADFAEKSQFLAAGRLTASFTVLDAFGPGVSIFYANVWPSDPSGGFLYRGYSEAGVGVFLFAETRLYSGPRLGMGAIGARAGLSASIAGYQYTTLSFFVPSVDLGAYFSWSPAPSSPWRLTLFLPARLMLRRDMSYSCSLGLELGASLSSRRMRP